MFWMITKKKKKKKKKGGEGGGGGDSGGTVNPETSVKREKVLKKIIGPPPGPVSRRFFMT